MQAHTKTAPNAASGRSPEDEATVRLVAQTAFPTLFGDFTLMGFADEAGDELTAVVRGQVGGAEDCPVRVHSECHTGDIFGSLRCDCREQLDAALCHIGSQPRGAVIYLRQEGRGIGLINKLHAYRLQDDEGMDTIEANQHLGFPVDARDYRIAARILELLKVRSVALMTNNMGKIEGLRAEGIAVTDRIPVVTSGNPFNHHYLETKRTRMGHLL
jgi:GTP cyclohydrolase II